MQRQVGEYRILSKLGSGTFGTVSLAVHKLTHVTEYAPHGDLSKLIEKEGSLPEAKARQLFSQVLSAINYMHNIGIVHRDIKAENILLSRPDIAKVADFGFSAVVPPDAIFHAGCGSPPYAAPELFAGGDYDGKQVDAWAMGVVLFLMVVGELPFRAPSLEDLQKLVAAGTYNIPDRVAPDCAEIIRGLISPSPLRWSLAALSAMPWLEGRVTEGVYLSPSLVVSKPSVLNFTASACPRQVKEYLTEIGHRRSQLTPSMLVDPHSDVSASFRIVLHRFQYRSTRNANGDVNAERQEADFHKQRGARTSGRS